MTIRVFENPVEAAAAVAHRLIDAIRAKPSLTLGLPAGRTPIPAYAELRRLNRQGAISLAGTRTFNLDEFVGLRADDPRSFRHFMEANLFEGTDLPPASIEFLDGAAHDLDAECRRYEAAIAGAGGIDLQLVGIGINGHIGFNEPGDRLMADTHRVDLRPETRLANIEQFGGRLAAVPHQALTMGMGTILRAKAIVLVATGESKAEVIARAVREPLTTHLPASFLQTHRSVELYLDRAAAAGF
ncbi:MAG TPA: glucosamine-6-phosphate deaminase [Vicinamibacterales bacterium]|nr:glucosamine-6-phosphate deaminase [Vicinamibacterales bacterium]